MAIASSYNGLLMWAATIFAYKLGYINRYSTIPYWDDHICGYHAHTSTYSQVLTLSAAYIYRFYSPTSISTTLSQMLGCSHLRTSYLGTQPISTAPLGSSLLTHAGLMLKQSNRQPKSTCSCMRASCLSNYFVHPGRPACT